MPVEIIDSGAGNRIDLHPWFEKYGRLKIEIKGNNSSIRIPEMPASCSGTNIAIGSDCSVDIGPGCSLSNTFIAGKDGLRVNIGARTTFTARARFIMHEATTVTLGEDCMIAADVQFMTSDNHTIFDATTRRRLNTPADIIVGDHVWIGLQVFVMKGARIGHNSVIGLGSVVTRGIPPHCVAAGRPAQVVRTGIDWDRTLWPPEANTSEKSNPEAVAQIEKQRATTLGRRWWQKIRG